MICAKNYEKLSTFVKATAKILSVPFFPDTVYNSVYLSEQQATDETGDIPVSEQS